MAKLENTVILRIEQGKFKGRRMLLPKEKLTEEISHALVEKGTIFGQPHFAMACLIHETFGNDQGCQQCDAESGVK